mgnify:CR=1 FL=1
MSTLILLAAAILACLFFSGFFSGSETGAISTNRIRLRNLQRAGDQRADDVISLLSDTQRILIVTLVGTNISNILATLFAKRFFFGLFAAWKPEASMRMADLAALLIMTPIVLIFAEITPKQFFREHADQLMLTFRKPLRFFSGLFLPAVAFFNTVTYIILRPFGIKKGQRTARFTKEDLRVLVGSAENNEQEISAKQNGIGGEVEMIQSIFKLEKTLLREVMKPLVDVIAVPLLSATTDTVLKTARRSGYTRLPVYENTIVNMIGYVDIYDILRSENGEKKELSEYVKPAFYVPETKRIDDLLQELLSNHLSVAIVFDEHGGCSGFVTLEDILEEIVGEIEDEFDRRIIEYYEEKPGLYAVDPKMDLDDLREELNISLPKRDCETVSGFIYSILGRVPENGESFKYGKYIIHIVEVKTPKITRVKIEIPQKRKHRKE